MEDKSYNNCKDLESLLDSYGIGGLTGKSNWSNYAEELARKKNKKDLIEGNLNSILGGMSSVDDVENWIVNILKHNPDIYDGVRKKIRKIKIGTFLDEK